MKANGDCRLRTMEFGTLRQTSEKDLNDPW